MLLIFDQDVLPPGASSKRRNRIARIIVYIHFLALVAISGDCIHREIVGVNISRDR